MATPEPASAEFARQRDRAAEVGGVGRRRDRAGRSVLSTRTWIVAGRGLGVAGRVGREDAQVVEAVGERGRVERGGVRRRGVDRRRRVHVPAPAGERWKVTVLTRAGRGVGGGRRRAPTLAPRRSAPGGGGGQRAGRAGPVDRDQDELGRLLAGVVGRADAQQARCRRTGSATRRRRARSVSTPSERPRVGDAGRGVSVHCSKRTVAMPVPVSVAVAVIVAGSAVARLTGFGAETESVGSVLSTVTVISGRREGVAGVVGRDDAEVVVAVGLSGRVPARGLVRPGARAGRGALEDDGRDAGAARRPSRSRARSCRRRRRRRPAP